MKSTKDKISEFTYDEKESLLHVKIFKNANISLDNVVEHYEEVRKLTNDKKYVALVDTSNYFKVEPEAFMHSSLETSNVNRIATAFYNPSIANRVTINFFKRFFKPAIPVEMFDSMEEALAWLENLKAG